MKVWLVWTGYYSSRDCKGVFSSRENADLFAGKLPSEYDGGRPQIQEVETDPLIPEISEGMSAYFVKMTKEGQVTELEPHTIDQIAAWRDDDTPFDVRGRMLGTMMARDEQHAIKIMNERRTMWLASGKKWGAPWTRSA